MAQYYLNSKSALMHLCFADVSIQILIFEPYFKKALKSSTILTAG